ncbi:peptide ABC transporter substrate-binding protein [Romeria aff. gracilis LEGE 07310]|uniref:Peptide ABC transporter substrate-binding protein n=1 Tax=Vasconcelosia minhoensis LEGE 07310 TaxID=915328 RepID=A0A8J7ASQ1_9CYAN|nr:peptide ABC transporter substrate-binding protein [Romeria gracilis]MBE9080071.1 peptide ABC transporter substrate-binding protein [Romeria aff. gracilis LEGE 07310]
MTRSFAYWLLGASLFLGLSGCSVPTANLPTGSDAGEPQAELDPTVLRLLYSRTPTTLNPHLANGFQDFEASRIVYEPLATYDPDGELVPVLAAEIPTAENGGLAQDRRSVTWRLRSDVRWSDGEPFTAADVVFTYEFIRNPEVAAVTAEYYDAIAKVEALDQQRIKITFKQPNPSWALPFTGQNGLIIPEHRFADYKGLNAREAPTNLQPVGTGPYRFITVADGRWIFAPNEQYWGTSPDFKLVELQGGIPPYVAAKRVLKTGEADFAHNIQLEVDERRELLAAGQGDVITTYGAYVERIMLNPTDPNQETETGEKSSRAHPHPFLSDLKVRQAIAYAIDRDAIATQLYGRAGRTTSQLLVAPTKYTVDTNFYPYNPDQANTLLDQAGWKDSNNDGIRDKDGTEMKVVFQTSINPVRQKTQEMVKADLKAVGIDVEIRRVLVDSFFSADPAETRSINHFYADMQEYNAGSDSPDPTIYMSWWLCNEIATQENQWQKPNNARYCNPAYDKLWQAAQKEMDEEKRAQLFQQMNQILSQDVAVLPLVRRAVTNGVSDRLSGVDPTPWDASTWDIGTWQRVEESAEAESDP